MSVIYTRDWNARPLCTFCGENRAVAAWRGATHEILLCQQCATNVIPKFVADAVIGDERCCPEHLSNAMLLIERNFLHGALLSSLRAEKRRLGQ